MKVNEKKNINTRKRNNSNNNSEYRPMYRYLVGWMRSELATKGELLCYRCYVFVAVCICVYFAFSIIFISHAVPFSDYVVAHVSGVYFYVCYMRRLSILPILLILHTEYLHTHIRLSHSPFSLCVWGDICNDWPFISLEIEATATFCSVSSLCSLCRYLTTLHPAFFPEDRQTFRISTHKYTHTSIE